MTRTRVLLLLFLIVLPLGFRLTTRALTFRGDRSSERRELVLEHFTADDIERGREYHRAYQPGGALAAVLSWGMLGWLLFGRSTRRLADWAARKGKGILALEVLLVGVPIFLLLRLVVFPISVYHGYLLEGAFGFRRLDLLPWLWRVAKGWAVGGFLQLVVGVVFFWLVRRFARSWPWPALAAGAAGSLALIVLWPVLVLPLFYQVSPLPAGELRDGIVAITESAGIEIDDVSVIDQSRVSGHTNAFFVGVGNRRSIYLYDTLQEEHSTPEILSVVGHEIGHWQARHVLKGWLLGMVGLSLGLFGLRWALGLSIVHEALGIRSAGDLAVIPLLLVLTSVAGLATAPLENAVSRHFERQADRAALDLTGDPETFIRMKETSVRANRTDLLPHPFVVTWYSTHPPAIDRIVAAVERQQSTASD